MNVISLFTGAGGLDLGLERAGFTTRFAVEVDRDCCKTIELNRPGWVLADSKGGDIQRITATQIFERTGLKRGEVDIVAGGPPCQSFSNIGKRGGIEDDRGSLVFSYIRLVEALKPRFFLFENVQGILQHPEALEAVVSALAPDYHVSTRTLNAADFGVPQHRKRVIVLGRLGAVPRFPAETHSDPRSPRLGTEAWVPVGEALDSIPRRILARNDNFSMRHSTEMQQRMAMIAPGKNFHSLPMSMRPNCWRNGKHQGADTFGRLDPTKPSVTIRCSGFNPTKGRYIHPYENRGLSTAEMAAIQTFPFDYKFYGSIGSVGRQIGNAVPPLLAEKLGESIAEQLSEGGIQRKSA